jgi:uncharacterized membrane protein HdeD (DUF308 family)
MSTTFQQARQAIESQITKARWALGINGALSVALGIVIIVWPNISLFLLVIVFGAFALARGVIGLMAAIASPVRAGRGWLVVSSLAGIAVGVLVFLRTDMSALALLYVIGAYAIVFGLITIGGGFWLPLDTGDRLLLTLAGFLSILFGIVMFAEPGAGALAVLALIAAYALIIGFSELTVAIGGERVLKRWLQPLMPSASKQSTSKASPSH